MDSPVRMSVSGRVVEALLKLLEFGTLIALSWCLVTRADPVLRELGITFLLYTVFVIIFVPLLWHWIIEESHNYEEGIANDQERSAAFSCVVYLAMSGLLGTSGSVLVITALPDGISVETEMGLLFAGFTVFLLDVIWNGYPLFWQIPNGDQQYFRTGNNQSRITEAQ